MTCPNDLDLSLGAAVTFNDNVWEIQAHQSLTSVLLHHRISGDSVVAPIESLSPVSDQEPEPVAFTDNTLGFSEASWTEAKRREAIIAPLAAQPVVPGRLAEEAAVHLQLSRRTIYTLIQRYRASGGRLTSLAPHRPAGGRGKGRLSERVEGIMADTIAELYLNRQRYRPVDVAHEIRRRCHVLGLPLPSVKAVRTRIRAIAPEESVRRRHGRRAAHRLTPVHGTFPAVTHPLEVVQIDHSPVDCMIVDDYRRQPIGRPYLTLGIDIYSRCITGFCLTLEAPSSVSVGLCLAHSVLDKETELRRLEIEGEWPLWGKPGTIHVDNGAEFHSEALSRGCDQHGIGLAHRPVGQPHFGGTIERVLGTLMNRIHTLPGTTFSNPQDRGAYESERCAALTLKELDKWLTLVIIGHYHLSVHSALNEPPIERLKQGWLGTNEALGPGLPPRVHNRHAFLIDFLPLVRRKIQRHGFVLDHIRYYSNALRPWIARRDRLERFIIRRDPRDISRIFVLDPDGEAYLEVPYQMLNRPAVTLWEHRESVRRLQQEGRAKVDEAAIFRTIEQMREITQRAAARTKAARRRQVRIENALSATMPPFTPKPEMPPEARGADIPPFAAIPFDDIEEW
jgi:putative transposase